jgi:hypothetical protein
MDDVTMPHGCRVATLPLARAMAAREAGAGRGKRGGPERAAGDEQGACPVAGDKAGVEIKHGEGRSGIAAARREGRCFLAADPVSPHARLRNLS